jgi:hypothetical protein
VAELQQLLHASRGQQARLREALTDVLAILGAREH